MTRELSKEFTNFCLKRPSHTVAGYTLDEHKFLKANAGKINLADEHVQKTKLLTGIVFAKKTAAEDSQTRLINLVSAVAKNGFLIVPELDEHNKTAHGLEKVADLKGFVAYQKTHDHSSK